MGAVQKLATVVIVGLVGLATLLVVYLANENNRREAEAEEQREVAIDRGIETYLKNCLVCHGPAGEGYTVPSEQGTGRIGMPLGGNTEAGRAAMETNQVVDEIDKTARARYLRQVIHNGRGLMPAWGDGAEGGALLNDEQIDELVLMIQEVDWDLVYNEAIEANDGEYPTPPPADVPDEEAAAQDAEADGEVAANGGAGGTEFTVESVDIDFNPNELTVPANTDVTINLPNNGASAHNFSIDALDISVDLPAGAEEQVTINAEPGEYEYYCNVPGHKEAGMVGTLIVSEDATAGDGNAAATPDEGDATDGDTAATPEAAAADGDAASSDAAAEDVTVEMVDIDFNPNEFTIPANTDVTVTLPNNGAAVHNFNIDELDLHSDDISSGNSGEVTINADAGEYEYYCDIPGHEEAGMVGTLTVE